MKRSKLGIGAILILSLLFFFPHHKTEVSFQENIIYLSDEAFSIGWIHSVEKEEWLEFYERRGNQILLTKTQFKTYGAGVPSSGKSSLTEDGYVEVEINRKMDELRLVVSPRVKSTMHLNNHDLLLYEIVEPYNEVVIKPVSLPVYQYAIYLLKREGLS
ncbi:DUF1850 domain-containing protein [Ammoniphilus sp. CFH 90114]|uniref:DUF1850 domain-containing protein n=1 Tax=Ammoniphilus sp. CFH 90114 TaxID=2493665 RepID=UPI00100FCCD1|nr:DUF1850 domain-containing protein [Ammoniphilus sp. CFH 90114]RXT09094.1 DUF1850 domain-containing protein [Ammoniphilus sp. CFH 90114]